MFITFVCVPKMLNFLNLDNTEQKYLKGSELLNKDNKILYKVLDIPFYCISFIHISEKETYIYNHMCI